MNSVVATKKQKLKFAKKKWKNPLIPLLYTFNVFGRFPFHRNKTGALRFRFMSLPMLRSVLFVLTITGTGCNLFISSLQSANWNTYDMFLRSFLKLIVLTTILHAVANWCATSAITKAVLRWNLLYARLEFYTKRPISQFPVKVAYIGLVFILTIFPIGLPYFSDYTYLLFTIIEEITYVVCCIYISMILLFWIVLCQMVISSVDLLKEFVTKSDDQTTRWDVSGFKTFRGLWIELNVCTTELVHAAGPTIYLWQTVNFLNLIGSSFVLLLCTQFGHTCGVDMNYTVINFVLNLSFIVVVFRTSHVAQKCIRDDILSTFLTRRWLRLTEAARTELDLLLDTIEMANPTFDILGVYTYSNSVLMSAFQAILTYLVIAMQLRYSNT